MPPGTGLVITFNTNNRLANECDAADRRKQYTGLEQFIELPASVKVKGEWTKGKKRYGTVDAVRMWLKENR